MRQAHDLLLITIVIIGPLQKRHHHGVFDVGTRNDALRCGGSVNPATAAGGVWTADRQDGSEPREV